MATPSNGDGDADLSFEALTFGEDSGHIKKENKVGKKKSIKKDRSSAPQENEKEQNASSVCVHTKNDSDRIDVQSLLKRLEQFGVVKASYFKEKLTFGFIQFLDPTVVEVVVDAINKHPSGQFLDDGVQIIAEKGTNRAGSPQSYGASMGTSFGMPFSPSTLSSSGTNATTFAVASPAQSAATPSSLASPPTPVVEKPDTILVLKNLPFSLKQDQLQEILMAMNTTAPQSINLHFDNMGVFRGMAFIKYRSLDDAIKVYEALNGYDVGGRKVRVEYKRKNKGQQTDIPAEWQEEEDLKKLWEQVRDFSANPNVNEISFTPNLSTNQRKHIHTMAEKLKLTHYSNGEGDLRYICIKKAAPPTPNTPTTPTVSGAPGASSLVSHNLSVPISQNGFALPIPSNDARAIDIKGRRPRRDSENNGNRQLAGSPNGHGNGSLPVGSIEKEFRSRGNSFKSKDVSSSGPSDVSMDWRVQSPQQQLGQSPSVSNCITIAPSRQPKGPDGSKGFGDLYRSARKHTCTFVPVSDSSVPEISAVV